MKNRVHLNIFVALKSLLLMGLMGCQVQTPSAGTTNNSALSAFNHNPLPQTCGRCHSKDQPGANVLEPLSEQGKLVQVFFHSENYLGGRDCASCHSSGSGAGRSFSGGVFDHRLAGGELVNACSTCHLDEQPGATVLEPQSLQGLRVKGFLHQSDYLAGKDCGNCHGDSTHLGINFAGGVYDHRRQGGGNILNCSECHQDEMPAESVFYPNTPGVGDQFHHSATYVNAVDCGTCHLKNSGNTWNPGTFAHMDSKGRLVATCKECHNHLQAQKHLLGMDYTNALFPDCTHCHNQSSQPGGIFSDPSVTWKRGL